MTCLPSEIFYSSQHGFIHGRKSVFKFSIGTFGAKNERTMAGVVVDVLALRFTHFMEPFQDIQNLREGSQSAE